MKELLEHGSYILAVVAEEEYSEAPECPHCHTGKDAVTIDQNMALERHLSDLMLCPDCANAFLVVCYPTLFETAEPVYMQITLKEGGDITTEVVASAVAQQIFATPSISEGID
jgi:rubredoxin